MQTELFWNQLYSQYPSRFPNEQDPMLIAAMQHFNDVKNARLLDLGCGNGSSSLFFAKLGAEVTAIDLSEIAIQNLSKFCNEQEISNIIPVKCSAFDIEQIGQFDFVFGNMILHHLEPFDQFSDILRKALTPGGKAFFRENSSRSVFLTWFRQNLVGKFGIPKGGDDEEFPLMPSEIEALKSNFSVEIVYSELLFFRLASQYLFRGNFYNLTQALDNFFLQFPSFRKYSYRQNLLLS